MGKTKVSTWYVHHQDRMEWYESQEAAIDAVDLFVSIYEDGIWSDRQSYLSLGHADGETVDSDLFNRRKYANALAPSAIGSIFRVDLFIKIKEDWIFKYGSDLLQQSLRAGYDCHDGYLAQRLARDYPGFKVNDRIYSKVDTPDERCLHACLEYQYAHCCSERGAYYIAVDNYLGKYQLIKPIDLSIEISSIASSIESIDDKESWIFERGSNLLQQSFLAGYNCNDRYLQEKVVYDYPGFIVNSGKYQKVDSPTETCLYACLGYENSYCSSHDKKYYITIDGFLGKYQLIKLIAPTQIAATIAPTGITNSLFGLQQLNLAGSIDSIKNAAIKPLRLAQAMTVCTITGTVVYVAIECLPRIFQAIVGNI